MELQEEQVLLQETSWSWLQGLLLPLQQTAFLTGAQTYWSPNLYPQTLHLCHPGVKPSLLLPLSLLHPNKGCGKAELVVPL